MEEAEPSHYVAQLKAEFDSCDTTSTGFLDREAVTALCRKLQLDAHLPLLLDSLLGGGSTYARVNFEEFKDNFVDVLSRSLDVSTSEDDSSYLEPVVPDEVKPKFVKGEKRYGRRSRPDARPDAALSCHSDISPPSDAQNADSSPSGVRRPKVRRSTSLDSVESLKSDGEPGSPKDVTQISFQSKGQDEPLAPAAQDLEHGVGLREFRNILCCSGPVSCSTPLRRMPQAAFEERSPRSTSPSLLTATLGPRVLSQLDDGSGCASPERVVALWTEEGIRNSRDILQTLDFPLEERLSLAELTLALDNELLVSGNGIHQAALISYRNEIQHLQGAAEQACKERDKAKVDLDLADRRNLQLVREVDDRHASMETLNHSRIRDLEQDFRDRLAVLRSQAEQESDAMLQQLERERGMLREELRLLKVQEAGLQEELDIATQENRRLEEELADVKRRLTEVESSAERLQKDLEQLLHDKFGSLDTAAAGPNPEERLCELIKEYEQRCRELQDKNDELNSELELLKCQRNDRKSGRPTAHKTPAATLSWNEPHCVSEPDSDDSEMKRRSSPPHQSKMDPADTTVSIHTELAVEQLKQKHNQEVQQLNIQLETQVNYYERTLDRIRQSMEVERKDIAQAFKLEINELEEQKTEAEQQARQLKEALDKLQNQIQHGGWSSEQERRVQRERADLEQNFAREIGNLVQKLSAEKDQLEAELKLKMDQEVSRVREEAQLQLSQVKLHHAEGQRRLLHQLHLERQRQKIQKGSEECLLREQVCSLQGEVQTCRLQLSQSEDSMGKFKGRCGQLEEELRACGQRCRELEENISRLEAEELQAASAVAVVNSVLQQEVVVDSVKTDHSRLIRDLTEQAMEANDLQEALKQQQSKVLQLQEEVVSLSQEKQSYSRMAEQLSTQIVEMEEEMSALQSLSSRVQSDLLPDGQEDLNSSASEANQAVEQLSEQLESKTGELVLVRGQNLQLQLAVMDSQNQLRKAQDAFECDKKKMRQQLTEMEHLVLVLEQVMDPDSSQRTRLEEVVSDNSALHERVSVLQQEVEKLEDDVASKRSKLEEMQHKDERSRQEEARLQEENSGYRQEVLSLSSRNLQLSTDNGELSARLRAEQESLRALQERLDAVSRQQEEGEATLRHVQEEAEQQQAAWRQERLQLEEELTSCRRKLSQLEAELSVAADRQQKMEAELSMKVEKLQKEVLSLQQEAERLRSQLHAITQENLGHAQEVSALRRKLQDAQRKTEEVEAGARKLMMEEEQEKQRQHLQQQQTVQQLIQDQQSLKSQLKQMSLAKMQAEGQADAALTLVQQQQEGVWHRERAEQLLAQLQEEQRRSRQLEEELKLQVEHSSSHVSLKQEQYEKAMVALQLRTEELESKLKGVRTVLQEKVQQLKEQMAKNVKSSVMLKDLYVENSQLMKALQVTEQHQKNAEKKNFQLEEKVSALNKLLREIVPASLAT
ncbi:ninein-like protein isoform X3 [Dunckerocampus dactyliophorus]|uniref:ninein-like protein isoform X3 n=1 Tax=Dunckerocampus dactyliophorus TaxID=161453 RepID=UPI002404FFF2|nr:ninein-like protein isoform X3 [Dunckerocampus dactyliophorus]